MWKTMRILFVVALLATFAATDAKTTEAVFGTPVSEIRAHGLADYSGHTLVAFYVSGREALISGQGQVLHLAAVKSVPQRVQISAEGSAEIPKTFVPMTGFKAFNYIVFAVPSADNSGIYLKNFDGTFPADPRVPTSAWHHLDGRDFSYDRMWYMSLLEFKALQLSQGGRNDYVDLDFTTHAVTSAVVPMRAAAPRAVPRSQSL